MIEVAVALANSIVQSAGSDIYKQCRKIISEHLGRLGRSGSAVAQYDETAARLQAHSSTSAQETSLWADRLAQMLDSRPSIGEDLLCVHERLEELLCNRTTSQLGLAGRDQYNIAGNAVFNRSSND